MTAKKNDAGKPRPELLSPDALLAISKVLAFGAHKYGDHNWRGGFDWSRLLGAAQRHLLAFQTGEDKDPESGLSHLAHLGCCVMFLLEHESRKLGRDDRYKHSPVKKEFQNPPLVDDDEPTIRWSPIEDQAVNIWNNNAGMGTPIAK